MEKKLPKVFAGKIDHKIDNNKEVFYSNIHETSPIKEVKTNSTVQKSTTQKINEIFASTNYVYKATVKIELPSGVVEKNIVGKNERYLITMDNEKIPLDDIKDIWVEK